MIDVIESIILIKRVSKSSEARENCPKFELELVIEASPPLRFQNAYYIQ